MTSNQPFVPMNEVQFEEYKRIKFDRIKHFLRESQTAPGAGSETDFISSKYQFDYPNRGLAVIFNNERFVNCLPEDNRQGSSVDELKLIESFTALDFHVIVFNDLTALQMIKAARDVATRYKHEDADCFVCVLLSHGEEAPQPMDESGITVKDHILIGSDLEEIETHSIVREFNDQNCPSLKNKPRLFFVQACRGDNYDDGVSTTKEDTKKDSTVKEKIDGGNVKDRTDAEGDVKNIEDPYKVPANGLEGIRMKTPLKKVKVLSVPLYQDCMIMYATPPGYYAWRNLENGSWFITELCQFLKRIDVGKVSFLRGLTSVSAAVAKGHVSSTDEAQSNNKKEMPVVDTMLTKDIFMAKKEEKTVSSDMKKMLISNK